MAKAPDKLAADFNTEGTIGLLAEEDAFDRRTLWRLGSWAAAAVGAVVVAVLANQSALTLKRDQTAAANIARQAQELQTLAKENRNETRRLAAAIDTLNADRDRLYSRVSTLEQGMDSVTGTIAKQATAPGAAPSTSAVAVTPAPAPVIAPVPATPPATLDKAPATTKPQAVSERSPALDDSSPASIPVTSTISPTAATAVEDLKAAAPPALLTATVDRVPEGDAADAPKAQLQRTAFGVDLGAANSLNGLRALWRGILKSKGNAALAALQPIVVIRENSNGAGMQLRLVAGPLNDAGAAAKICASVTPNQRTCETAVYEGQRLTLREEPAGIAKPVRTHRRVPPKQPAPPPAVVEEQKPEPSTISSIFRRNSQ